MLRAELGFYVGCLNLRDQLTARGLPVCYPVPAALGEDRLGARGLYDASLALTLAAADGAVTGNDLAADGKQLIMITGANQGGKSTFLRSFGQAQLMLQAGMFAAAESFDASACSGIFTHFKREEDATMEQGKLDEELDRMSLIASRISAGALLLCNESFASTNEREGSEIARQIIRALTEGSIRVAMSPTSMTWPKAATRRTPARPCSCVRNGAPTGSGPSGFPRANRCPPATARTCTGRCSRTLGSAAPSVTAGRVLRAGAGRSTMAATGDEARHGPDIRGLRHRNRGHLR